MKIEAGKVAISKKERGVAHLLMFFLVISWGIEYSMAKIALTVYEPIQLLFLKYCIGIFVFIIMKFINKVKWKIKKSDIPIFILCALSGEILYYWCEYAALDYISVSMVTIMLTFVPILSIGIERVFFKIKSNWKINVGVCISIVGVVFIIGLDFDTLNERTMIGYALCLGAIIAWNVYNFVTSKLRGDYHTITVGMTQLICTAMIAAPIALRNLPIEEMGKPEIIGSTLYLGIFAAGLGFFCYIFSVGRLGPTTNAVYSVFMPVSATFFGWLLIGETVGIFQVIGGIIVISAGLFVIKEKGKLDQARMVASANSQEPLKNE